MVRLGNWLFHHRNYLFPVFYFLLFIPSGKALPSLAFPIAFGFLIAFSGQLMRFITIGLVYIIRGGKNRRIYAEGLVTEGLFSHCRNPLYVGNILIIAGLGVMSNSLLFMAVLIPLFLFFYQAIVLAEEDFLRNKFGSAYDEYTSEVNRWIPKLGGLGATLSSMSFKWKKVLIKEYNTTFIWMTGALLVFVKNIHDAYGIEYVRMQMPVLTAVFFCLLLFYFSVRFMKKTKRWTAD